MDATLAQWWAHEAHRADDYAMPEPREMIDADWRDGWE